MRHTPGGWCSGHGGNGVGNAGRRLQARFGQRKDTHSDASCVRIHRAISWLERAEAAAHDHDACFIFLWIAFNAAYAADVGSADSARDQLRIFFARLLALDADRRLHTLLFERFCGPIRTLIGNKFVFEPFWRALREHDASERWREQFKASRKVALRAIVDGHTDTVLGVVFDRLYVLRNQLVHGGATWNSKVNREQVRDGVNILLAVVPVVLELMLEHPEAGFGDILYPVLQH